MAHSLYRLAQKAWNTPHLITQEALSPILEYLSTRNGDQSPVFAIVPTKQAPKKVEMVANYGEICIDGTLTYKPLQAACSPEGCSYQGILEQAEELIASGVDTIIMTHSSPGGEASHAFSTAQELRQMCDDNSVRLISYIDTYSASASYLLACVADEIVIHPSASAGSIGCVVALTDFSKAMEMSGIKTQYIASTPGKTPFADDGSFSKEFLSQIQEDVTRLGNQFAQHVSDFTSIPVADVLALDAKMFHAEKALSIGLVNQILDHNQFAAYLAEPKGNENA